VTDVHIKLSDGVREVDVEISGSDDEPLQRAEDAAVRLLGRLARNAPAEQRIGFNNWALSSETERSPEE
jgi:hypothetical protein